MDDKNLVKALDMAIEKSKAGKLDWRQTFSKEGYRVDFERSSVEVAGGSSGTLYFHVRNASGDIVATLMTTGGEDTPVASKLRELRSLAKNSHLQFDETMENVFQGLQG